MSIIRRLLTLLNKPLFAAAKDASLDFIAINALASDRRPMLRGVDLEKIEDGHRVLMEAVADTQAFASRVVESLKSELDRARRRSSIISDAVVDSLITVNYQGTIIDVNKAAEDLLGQSAPLLLGTSINALRIKPPVTLEALIVSDANKYVQFASACLPPTRNYEECRSLYLKFVNSGLGEPKLRNLAFTLSNKLGREIDVEATVTLLNPETSSADSCVYFIVMRDVTYQNEVEERMEGLQQFKHSLLSALPNPVFYKDAALRIVGYNQAFVELLELEDCEKARGKTLDDLLNGPDAAKFREIDESLKDKKTQDIQSHRVIVHTCSGREKEVMLYCTALRDSNHSFTGMLGTMIDLTLLLSVQNLQSTLLASVPNPVFYLDAKLKQSACNEAYANLMGINSEDLLGKSLEESLLGDGVINSDNRVMLDKLKQSDFDLYSGRASTQEFELQVFNRMTEACKDVLVYRVALRDGGKFSGIMSILTDITNIKALNRFQDQLFDAIPNPVFFKSNTLVYSGLNKAFSDWFGLEKADILGRSWDEILLHAERRFRGTDYGYFIENNFDSIRDMLTLISEKDSELYAERQEHPQVFEHRMWNIKHRQFRDVLFYRNGLYDDDGRFIGVVGSMLDVTELRDANRLKDSLIKSFPLAVYQADLEGRILKCNEKFAALIGLTSGDIEGTLIANGPAEALMTTVAGKTISDNTHLYEIADPRDPKEKLLNYQTKVLNTDGAQLGTISLYLGVSPLFQQLSA